MSGLTITIICVSLFIVVAPLIIFASFYKKITQGYALIRNGMGAQPNVYFGGAMVYPIFNKMEVMKISLITLEIDRRAKEGLICKDNLRADITVAFYLRVNQATEDVLKVAKSIGVERASDKVAVNELFNAKFSEALKTAGKQMNLLELFDNRIQFRERIAEVIGDDLNGYILEDVAIDYLEQTSAEHLDSNNIQDAEGIRRITEATAEKNVLTNHLKKDEQLAITKKNVETKEAMLALERQQADAEARQTREVETIQAREQAETKKVQQEETLKSEKARIDTEEQVAIGEENKKRQIEVAEKNRERAVVIESEKVIKAQQLEEVNREREVALEQISKEKALEEERKIIAVTISERIATERKVAEEEERIKEVKEVSEADRAKQVVVLEAEARAEEKLIDVVKMAQADEQKAVHKAKEVNLMAQAELEAAGKQAEAKKKQAEGTQAQMAASGLAEAKVQEARAGSQEAEGLAQARIIEAKADANEKTGMAEARVLEERLLAQAKGDREIGLSKAAVDKEQGLSEANVLEEKLLADAKGQKELGLARASAQREEGLAGAEVIEAKAKAEAQGLVDKFEAMANMSEDARSFEEFKMNLDAHLKEALAGLSTNEAVAKEQAMIMATALENSNIDIVGGTGDYFDKYASSLGMGNAVNGFLEKTPVVQSLLTGFLGGKAAQAAAPAPAEKTEKSE